MRVSGHSSGLNGTISPNFGVFKEHPCSTHWARGDQRHLPLGPIDPVVMAGERRRQKNQQGKKTKKTTANQKGKRFRAEGLGGSSCGVATGVRRRRRST